MKYLMAVLSFLPFASFLFLLFVTPNLVETHHSLALTLDTTMDWIMKISLLLGVIACLVHLFRSKIAQSTETKALWAVVIVFGNLMALPFYWFFRVRPGPAHVGTK